MPAAKRRRPNGHTFDRILSEAHQHHDVRQPIYEEIEGKLERSSRVVALFTSFRWDVILEDPDADMLEEVLQNTTLDGRELVLLLNSPGGDGLTAERIVNICRSYSPQGFSVIVPKAAKSAATMISLGATKIVMSKTSELGPIDPQIRTLNEDGTERYRAAHEIIESYNELMRKATRAKGLRIEPYLQQLQRFDARDIRWIKSAQILSERIAVGLLRGGTFSGRSPAYIRKRVKPFLDPRSTVVHGRPIYADAARQCGLNVHVEDIRSDLWRAVWKLYQRLNYCVSTILASKIIESLEDSYQVSAPTPRS